MNSDEILRRLTLLPEGWAEENVQSWQDAINYYKRFVFDHPNSRFEELLDLVRTISRSEQVKLFRTYPDGWMLIISTSSMKDEPIYGDKFIIVGVDAGNSAHVVYCRTTGIVESIDCKSHEIMTKLQPLLDRLWNETRGSKNV